MHTYSKACNCITCICIQVNKKTKEKKINQTDAIFEVYTDHVIEQHGNNNKALLWIVSIPPEQISEFCVCNI